MLFRNITQRQRELIDELAEIEKGEDENHVAAAGWSI